MVSNNTIIELKKQYEEVCRKIVFEFENKQDVKFSHWHRGSMIIAMFLDNKSMPLQEIIYDLETEQPKGLVFKWYDEYTTALFYNNYYPYVTFKKYVKKIKYAPELPKNDLVIELKRKNQ